MSYITLYPSAKGPASWVYSSQQIALLIIKNNRCICKPRELAFCLPISGFCLPVSRQFALHLIKTGNQQGQYPDQRLIKIVGMLSIAPESDINVYSGLANRA
jgi:hypothetical protein